MADFNELFKKNKKSALAFAVAAAFSVGIAGSLTGCKDTSYDDEDEEEEENNTTTSSSSSGSRSYWHPFRSGSSSSSSSKSSISKLSGSKSSGYSGAKGGSSSSWWNLRGKGLWKIN